MEMDAFFDNLASGIGELEHSEFGFGTMAADIPGPSVFVKTETTAPASAASSALQSVDGRDDMKDVIEKVASASKNIQAVMLKVAEWEAQMDVLPVLSKELLSLHVFPQKAKLMDMQADYMTIVQTRMIPGSHKPTTNVDIKRKLMDDAKFVKDIVTRLKAVASI